MEAEATTERRFFQKLNAQIWLTQFSRPLELEEIQGEYHGWKFNFRIHHQWRCGGVYSCYSRRRGAQGTSSSA